MTPRPVANPYLRVSDAERQEVADILKQHASDGRLDTAEFEARLDRTLRAKTRADLAGLLDDLPNLSPGRVPGYGPPPHSGYPPGPYEARRRSRGLFGILVGVALAIAAFSITLSFIAHAARPHFFWLIVLIVAFVAWRRNHGDHRWRA